MSEDFKARLEAHAARQQTNQRDVLYERFRKVIVMAGYKNGAPQRILDEYFEQYMGNIPEFVKMLEEYETKYADDPDGDPID